MPHLIIERLRRFPELFVLPFFGSPEWKTTNARAGAYIIEVLGVAASCIFVAGSVCFLPQYAEHVATLFAGCLLFIIGSTIYCVICTVTLTEALMLKGSGAYEAWENFLYLAGSVLYLVGSVLYMPEKVEIVEMRMVSLSLSQVCQVSNFSDHQYTGTVLFIVGSVLFVVAAFLNALNPRKFDETSSRLLTATTSSYMIGSLLFAVGSVAFLPGLGCGEDLLNLAAWCFIVGSAFFLVGDSLSLYRTARVFLATTDKSGEQYSLLGS